jgi:hypothetical protein
MYFYGYKKCTIVSFIIQKYATTHNLLLAKIKCCLVLSSISIDNLLNTVLGSHDNWHTLVDEFRGDLHNTLSSGGGKSSSLFHDERHGSSLIKKTKLSVLVLGVSGVSEYSSVKKGTVNISNHGSDVTRGVSLSGSSGSLTPCLNGLLHWLVPLLNVSLVERNNRGVVRDLNIRLGKYELSNFLIKSEHVNSVSKGNNKESGGRIQTVSSSYKLGSRLKCVGKAVVIGNFSINKAVLIVIIDSNDGSGGDSSVNIGGSIKGIEYSNIFSSLLNNKILVLPGSGKFVISSSSFKGNLRYYQIFH